MSIKEQIALDIAFLEELALYPTKQAYADAKKISLKGGVNNRLSRIRKRYEEAPNSYERLSEKANAYVVQYEKKRDIDDYITLIEAVKDASTSLPKYTDGLKAVAKQQNRSMGTIRNVVSEARSAYIDNPDQFSALSSEAYYILEINRQSIPRGRTLEFIRELDACKNIKQAAENAHVRDRLVIANARALYQQEPEAIQGLSSRTIKLLGGSKDYAPTQKVYTVLEQIPSYGSQKEAADALDMSEDLIYGYISRAREGYQKDPDYFGFEPSEEVKSLLHNVNKPLTVEDFKETCGALMQYGNGTKAKAATGINVASRLRAARELIQADPEFSRQLNAQEKEIIMYGMGYNKTPFSWQISDLLAYGQEMGTGALQTLMGITRKGDFVAKLEYWATKSEEFPALHISNPRDLFPDLFDTPTQYPHPGHEVVLAAVATSDTIVEAAKKLNEPYHQAYRWLRYTINDLQQQIQRTGAINIDFSIMSDLTDGAVNNINDVVELMQPRKIISNLFKISDLLNFIKDVARENPKTLYEYAMQNDLSIRSCYHQDILIQGLVQLGVLDKEVIPAGYPITERRPRNAEWLKQKALDGTLLSGGFNQAAAILEYTPSQIRHRVLMALTEGKLLSSALENHYESHPISEPLLTAASDAHKGNVIFFQQPSSPLICISAFNEDGITKLAVESGTLAERIRAQASDEEFLGKDNDAYLMWDKIEKALIINDLSLWQIERSLNKPDDLIKISLQDARADTTSDFAVSDAIELVEEIILNGNALITVNEKVTQRVLPSDEARSLKAYIDVCGKSLTMQQSVNIAQGLEILGADMHSIEDMAQLAEKHLHNYSHKRSDRVR